MKGVAFSPLGKGGRPLFELLFSSSSYCGIPFQKFWLLRDTIAPMNRRLYFPLFFLALLTFCALILVAFLLKNSLQASIVIEWSTASELDTIGFNVFRSESADDPGIQINPRLIPASADSFAGADYQFVDINVQPGHKYFYWLEDVNASGSAGRNGPIEASSGASLWLEWLLIAGLMGVLTWGWISLFRPRPEVITTTIG
jgi:hypothetical protein